MARKKNIDDMDDLAGTVEGLARDHFEREKAAYEERTGTKVEYVPPVPVTRTPVESSESGESVGSSESAESGEASESDSFMQEFDESETQQNID